MDMRKLPATIGSNSATLGQLSDEVNRIASTLARLSMQPEVAAKADREQPANDGIKSDIEVETVRKVVQARHLRYQFFDMELFADPAWDMLLDLFRAEIAQLRVSVSSLSIAANVPPTTALRWINTMTNAGLFRRLEDPNDRRRVFVELSPMASDAMRRYFKHLDKRSEEPLSAPA